MKTKIVLLKKNPVPFFCLIFLLGSCATKVSKIPPVQKKKTLSLLFAGDIMAHRPNYMMKDFNKIWTSVKDDVSNADLSFGNIESPVDDNLDFSTYPNFNFKKSYASAILDAGFNVLSLVNNHTNDQGKDGMMETLKWSEEIEKESKASERAVYFSGLKHSEEDSYSFHVFEKNGYKILFLAITECLNRPDFSSFMNYVRYTKKGREGFTQYIKKLSEENPHDLFILSVHMADPEYIHEVTDSRRNYFLSLIENGVDIIWANHPHVVREHDLIMSNESKKITNLIMYGNGNTISGQRYNPDLSKPETPHDDTGDGLMIKVKIERDENDIPYIENVDSLYITTYIDRERNFVIRKLDDDFIDWLKENDKKWSSYIEARKEITEKTKENIIWQ